MFAAFIKNVYMPIVAKLSLIPFAKKILSRLCYKLCVKINGRFFNVKKSTSLKD